MRFDLHIHSSHSRDGTVSPKDVLRQCSRLGLAGFAIADHNQIEGSREAFQFAKSEGLIVVRAVEVSTQEGHVLAYGVEDLIQRGLSIPDTIDRIHGAGGIAVAAHPVRFPSGMGLELAEQGGFDAIEVLNGGSSGRANRKAKRLAEKHHWPVTAGSDAHKLEEIGKTFVDIDKASSEDDIIDVIRKGRANARGRSRSGYEGFVYSMETLSEWMKGSFKRL